MRFSIAPDIFTLYPDLTVGVVYATNVKNAGFSEEIIKMFRRVEADVPRLMTTETFKEHPHIKAWQDAHRAFRSNPNEDQPSIQALLKRVLQGRNLPSINILVDLYNIISLKHLVPVGGEDLDAVRGDIQLTRADGTESFVPIGRTENEPPEIGEVIYRDTHGVICRKFNWHEADRTKLTPETKRAVLVIEGLPPVTGEHLRTAVSELANLVTRYCCALTTVWVLTRETPSCELN